MILFVYLINSINLDRSITYIVSNIDKSVAFEWITEEFYETDITLNFIFLNTKEPYLHHWLKKRNVNSTFIEHSGKKSILKNSIKIIKLLKKQKPLVIHTHLFDATIIGLFASKILRIKKRIYTRHHSTFHHEFYPKAVKLDKLCNYMATDIVAISENVKNVLIKKENVSPKKTHLIHHGFDLNAFEKVDVKSIFEIKEKYKIYNDAYPVIGVISRYIKWKGIHHIIPAFKNILNEHPNARLVLANADGPDKKYIQSLLQQELPSKSYIEIPFENNIFALYQIFDIYIHVPINDEIEAFGQTYVEALAAGIPSVFTLSGVAKEFIKHKENALVVDYKNSDAIYEAINLLISNKKLADDLVVNGKNSIKPFKLNLFIKNLKELYG